MNLDLLLGFQKRTLDEICRVGLGEAPPIKIVLDNSPVKQSELSQRLAMLKEIAIVFPAHRG